jgi:hypothetical protein
MFYRREGWGSISFPHIVQTGSGDHPAFYTVGVKWQEHLHPVLRLRMVEVSLHLPIHLHDLYILHRKCLFKPTLPLFCM